MTAATFIGLVATGVAIVGVAALFVIWWDRRQWLDAYARDLGLRRRRFESNRSLRARMKERVEIVPGVVTASMAATHSEEYLLTLCPAHMSQAEFLAEVRRRRESVERREIR